MLQSILVFIVHSSPWHQERVKAPGDVLLAACNAEMSEMQRSASAEAGTGRPGTERQGRICEGKTLWLHQLLKERKNTHCELLSMQLY